MLSAGSGKKRHNIKVMIVIILAQTGERCVEKKCKKDIKILYVYTKNEH